MPNNLKSRVTKYISQEFILNPTDIEMAKHCNTVVIPARVRHLKISPVLRFRQYHLHVLLPNSAILSS